MRRQTAVSRRTALQLATAAGAAAIGPTPLAAQNPEFLSINAAQADDLLAVSRTLFPHDFLEDDAYIRVVKAVDERAAGDAAVRRALDAGLRELGDNFAAMSEADREAALALLEGTEFFRTLYNETLNGLYRDPQIATVLGNEGSSIEFGGFIERGFDDIDWLPDD